MSTVGKQISSWAKFQSKKKQQNGANPVSRKELKNSNYEIAMKQQKPTQFEGEPGRLSVKGWKNAADGKNSLWTYYSLETKGIVNKTKLEQGPLIWSTQR